MESQCRKVVFLSILSFKNFTFKGVGEPCDAEEMPSGDLRGRLSNGTMLYGFLSDESLGPVSESDKGKSAVDGAVKQRVKVNKDGSITDLTFMEKVKDRAWRPGMLPLRDMKKHWTLQEFTEMDSEFRFNIKAGGKSNCQSVTLDADQCNDFQRYVREGEFQYGRYGFLYGKFEDDNKVRVDFIYEPIQGVSRGTFQVLEGSEAEEERVDRLCEGELVLLFCVCVFVCLCVCVFVCLCLCVCAPLPSLTLYSLPPHHIISIGSGEGRLDIQPPTSRGRLRVFVFRGDNGRRDAASVGGRFERYQFRHRQVHG